MSEPYKIEDIHSSRQSEFEIMPSLYKECRGVWLDEFTNHWITPEIIEDHLKINKLVCIVSPELHGRNNIQEWLNYKNFITNQFSDNLILCTDNPEDAKKYFLINEKHFDLIKVLFFMTLSIKKVTFNKKKLHL